MIPVLALVMAGNLRATTLITINNNTNLSTSTTYSNNANPSPNNDYEFNLNTYTSPGGFTLGGSIQYGSLNDVSTQAITITGTSITLVNTNGNGVSGNSADLLYVASGSSLTVSASSSSAIFTGKTGNIDVAGTFSVGANGLRISTGNITFTGAGTTNLSSTIVGGTATSVIVGNGTNGTLAITGSGSTGTGVTVNVGGTLIYGTATANASSSAANALHLSGGALKLDGTAGITSQTASLTLSGANTLDLVAGGNSVALNLATSGGLTINSGGTLVISDWSGSSASGSTSTAINYAGSFSGTDLTNITWASGTVINGVTYGTISGSLQVNGQIIPNMADGTPITVAPEPTTAFAALLLAGLLTWNNRRRLLEAARKFSTAR